MKKTLAYIERIVLQKLSIKQWLALSCSFSMILLAARILTSHRLSYGCLAWNLFLAAVPFFISEWFAKNPKIISNKIKLVLLMLLWILFIPNSFYIVTDLFHLHNWDVGQPWFDLTLILSFAWNGILFGILSVQKMETILARAKGKIISIFVIMIVMWLSAFGVYIGRFLRFNSWDVFLNPLDLLSQVGNILLDPYDNRYVWAISFCFAGFMIILYYTIKKLSDVFKNG